jgi:hypothetical protein
LASIWGVKNEKLLKEMREAKGDEFINDLRLRIVEAYNSKLNFYKTEGRSHTNENVIESINKTENKNEGELPTPSKKVLDGEILTLFEKLSLRKLDSYFVTKIESMKLQFESTGKLSLKQIETLNSFFKCPDKHISLSQKIRNTNLPVTCDGYIFILDHGFYDKGIQAGKYPCVYRDRLGFASQQGFVPCEVVNHIGICMAPLNKERISWGEDFEVPKLMSLIEIKEFIKIHNLYRG